MSIGILPSIYLIRNDKPLAFSSFNRFQILSYAECEYLWSYGGKLVLLSRNLLNALARSPSIVFFAGGSFSRTIKNVVTHLKLFSIVGVPFTLVDLASALQKICKSALMDDKEGLVMSSLSFTVIAADAMDSVTTFVNALLIIMASNPLEVFSAIGLPCGFLMSGVGTISRTIQIAKACNLHQAIHSSCFLEIQLKDKAILKKELAEKIGFEKQERLIKLLSEGEITPLVLEEIEKLKEKRKEVIVRMIPKDAMGSFERLITLLEAGNGTFLAEEEISEVFKALKEIRCSLEKKIKVNAIGIVANLFVVVALILFSASSAGSLPFLLMSIAFSIRLISLVYQDRAMQQLPSS